MPAAITPYSHKLLKHFFERSTFARSLYTVHTHLLHVVIQGTTIAQVVKALFESMDFHANVSQVDAHHNK